MVTPSSVVRVNRWVALPTAGWMALPMAGGEDPAATLPDEPDDEPDDAPDDAPDEPDDEPVAPDTEPPGRSGIIGHAITADPVVGPVAAPAAPELPS